MTNDSKELKQLIRNTELEAGYVKHFRHTKKGLHHTDVPIRYEQVKVKGKLYRKEKSECG